MEAASILQVRSPARLGLPNCKSFVGLQPQSGMRYCNLGRQFWVEDVSSTRRIKRTNNCCIFTRGVCVKASSTDSEQGINSISYLPTSMDSFQLLFRCYGYIFLTFYLPCLMLNAFEHLRNPGNCKYRVMQLGTGGDYSLAFCHTDEESLEWGLSPEMIADQKWRAHSKKGSHWNENCSWYLDEFFDSLADSGDSVDEEYEECNASSYSDKILIQN